MDHHIDQQLAGLAGLGDPLRRAPYRHVAERGQPMSRDDAATAAGISRPLAAYHLDRLVDDGLLEPRYRRRGGRQGQAPAARPNTMSAPPPRSSSACPTATTPPWPSCSPAPSRPTPRARPRPPSPAPPPPSAPRSAPSRRSHPTPQPPRPGLAALHQTLEARGYEPHDQPDGTIWLRNCPFDRIATHHRQLVCGANHAMLQALTDHLHSDPPIHATLNPQPGHCCLVLTRAS